MKIRRVELEQSVRQLELPEHDYVIFGSAPLLIHGLISSIGDIDIVARGRAWDKATQLAKVLKGDKGDSFVQLGCIAIYDGWMGEDIQQLINCASFHHALPYAHLQAVLRYKQRLGREKDMGHIELIEAYLSKLKG